MAFTGKREARKLRDKTLVKKVWTAIERTVTAGGFIELAQETGALLAPLLS